MTPRQLLRPAAVDIGTNSTRLLIADVDDNGRVLPVFYQEALTRLGAGFLEDGSLDAAAVQRVAEAVSTFSSKAKTMAASEVRLFATSAVRDAANREEVVRQIRQQSGEECVVLSGEEEARLTFLGAASGIDWKGRWVLCDVGGGSTEIIVAEDGTMSSFASLQLGSSRETRRFFRTDPPTPDEQQALRRHARSVLRSLPPLGAELLVASGGTAYTAAVLCEKGDVSDPFALEGREVHREELDDLITKVMRKPLSERRELPGLPAERAEVLPAGLLIYREMMDFFGVQKLMITLRDALFGAVLEKEWSS